MFRFILDKIKSSIVRRASAHKMIDIVEVRTKEIGLTQVTTETDIRIKNAFFLPITILSIKTDLLNRDGLKVGSMSYEKPQKIKGKSDAVLTTISQISIITSLFQALSSLLAQHIMMHSVGVAKVKFLWWVFEIPVDDFFEIHPNKLKIVKEETEEERLARKQKEAEWKEKYEVIKEQKKTERDEKRAQWKEDILKRRYKESYIPKAERIQKNEPNIESAEAEKTDNVSLILDEKIIQQMAEEQTSTVSADTDNENEIAEENNEIKSATDSDNI